MKRQRTASYVPDRRVPLFGMNTGDRYLCLTKALLPGSLQVRILGMEARNSAAAYIQRIFRLNRTNIRAQGVWRRFLENLF